MTTEARMNDQMAAVPNPDMNMEIFLPFMMMAHRLLFTINVLHNHYHGLNMII
jgi:hypothetical protein